MSGIPWKTTAVAAAVFVVAASAGITMGGFAASVTSQNKTGSGTTVLADTVTGGTGPCTSTGGTSIAAGGTTDTNSANCPDDATPTGTIPTTPSTSSVTTTLSNPSTLTAGIPTLSAPTCGVESVLDQQPAADHGIVYRTVTNGVTGALTGGTGMSFNQGSSAYIATVGQVMAPTTFSLVSWFRFTANSDTGTLIGFTDKFADSGQTNNDRVLWLNSRKVVFGVNNGATRTITSGNLSANTWHLAVATLGSNGQRLYIDGNQVASATGVTSANTYTGYWHIGWGGEATGWGLTGFNAYYPGTLDNVAVVPSQMTAAQVTALYGQTTDAGAASYITSTLGATNYWPLNDLATQTYNGNLPVSSATTYADLTGGGNTASVAQGTVIAGSSGPVGGTSITLDGTSAYVTSPTAYNNPQPLTVTAYFKTSVAQGTVFSFDNTQFQGPSMWDRHLWLDPTGHLVWGVYPNAVQEVTSPGTYADGAWHQVVTSVGAAGMKLYVDGALVASNAAIVNAQVFTGYWHIGWGNEQNVWTNPPSNPYWLGSVAHMAVFPTQLSNAQVANLYSQSTVASLESTILGLSPTFYWPLQETNTTVAPCSAILATAQVTQSAVNTCVYPAGAGSCPATPTLTLAGLGTPANLKTGATQTVVITLTRVATVPAPLPGTHIYANVKFNLANGSFTATLNHLSGAIDL